MSFDIYGQVLRDGHCEIHPNVPTPYPCHYCTTEDLSEAQPEPCEGCYYATGEMQECDGSCA